MKPSEVLRLLNELQSEVETVAEEARELAATYSALVDRLDDGATLAEIGVELAPRECDGTPIPYKLASTVPLKADGTPRQKPGRKPKASQTEGDVPACRTPIDQDQNGRELSALCQALADHGPLSAAELVSRSGVAALDIRRHLDASAVIEVAEVDGMTKVRLISQRPKA